ncbi:hypothetical protein Noda2021_06040 [Candidatus Dependentiae bacterium Noda2021]|nr:hypothetical protein Noda2021_06040 [Candidatus Dependentiae bacterium Noda2021]
MKKITMLMVFVFATQNSTAMDHQQPIGPIVRSWLVSIVNHTTHNIAITAPDGSTLKVLPGQTKSGTHLLNLDPSQGEKNSSTIKNIADNKILGFLDISFIIQSQLAFNKLSNFIKVIASLNSGNSTFFNTIPLAVWSNTYLANEFVDGNEMWNFEVSLVLSAENLGGSSINVIRRIKETR